MLDIRVIRAGNILFFQFLVLYVKYLVVKGLFTHCIIIIYIIIMTFSDCNLDLSLTLLLFACFLQDFLMKKVQFIQQLCQSERNNRYKNKQTRHYAQLDESNCINRFKDYTNQKNNRFQQQRNFISSQNSCFLSEQYDVEVSQHQFVKTSKYQKQRRNHNFSKDNLSKQVKKTEIKTSKVIRQYHICTITPSMNIIFNMAEMNKIPPFTYDIVFDQNIETQKVIAYQYQTKEKDGQDSIQKDLDEIQQSISVCLIILFPIMNYSLQKLIQNNLIKVMILMSKTVTLPRDNRLNQGKIKRNNYKQGCKMIKKLLKNRFNISYEQTKGEQYYKIIIKNRPSHQNQYEPIQVFNQQQQQDYPCLTALDFQSILQLQRSSYLNFGSLINASQQRKQQKSISLNSSLRNSRNTIMSKNEQDRSQIQLFYILFQKKIQNSFQFCLNYFRNDIMPKIYELNKKQFEKNIQEDSSEQNDQIMNFYNSKIGLIKKIYKSLISEHRFATIIGSDMCQQIKQKLYNYKYKDLKAIIWDMIIDPKITTVPDEQIEDIQQQIVQNVFKEQIVIKNQKKSNKVDDCCQQIDETQLKQIKQKAQKYNQLFSVLLNQMNLTVVDNAKIFSKLTKIQVPNFRPQLSYFFKKLLKNQVNQPQSEDKKENKNKQIQSKSHQSFLKKNKLFMEDKTQEQGNKKVQYQKFMKKDMSKKYQLDPQKGLYLQLLPKNQDSLSLSYLQTEQMLLQNITQKDQTQSVKLIDQIFNQYSKISSLSKQTQQQYLNFSKISILSKQNDKKSLKESQISNLAHLQKQTSKNIQKSKDKSKEIQNYQKESSKSLKQDIKSSLKQVHIQNKKDKLLLNNQQKEKNISKSGSAASIMTPKTNTLHKTSISKSKTLNGNRNSIKQISNKQNKKQVKK